MSLGKQMTKEDVRQWGLDHLNCELCGIPVQMSITRRWPAGLQTHHIIGGSSRKNYSWNLLRLCSRCHNQYHSGGERGFNDELMPEVDLALLLSAKRIATPHEWKPELLKELRARNLPDLRDMPALLQQERDHYNYKGGSV